MKIHWVRKSYYCNPVWNNYYGFPDNKKRAFYDLTAACGYDTILHSTVIRKNVTCKNCLRSLDAKKHNNKTR